MPTILIQFLSKYKKELIIFGLIGAMALGLYIQTLRIDNLELKLDNKIIELQVEKDSHLSCKSSLGVQKLALDAYKIKSKEQGVIILASQIAAAKVKESNVAKINEIKNQTKIKSCDAGMSKLLESLK